MSHPKIQLNAVPQLDSDEGKEPQVTSEMYGLDGTIDMLDKKLTGLEERLQPVLRVEPSTPCRLEEKSGLVLLAKELQDKNERLKKLADDITSILNRLEL